jgi:predicted Zn-dependent peptidase
MMDFSRVKAPEIKTISEVHFPNPSLVKLDNGIPVHTFNLGSQEAVHIELIFSVSRSEGKNPLVAKAVNEIIGEASSTKAPGVLNEAIDFHGAFLESTYSIDHSSISLYTLTKKIDLVLPIFAEVVLDAVFPQRELEIYLTNAKQKFLVSQEKVDALVRRLYSQHLYGDHYYAGRTELHHYEDVTVEDLEKFYANFYTASNCEIIVSGKFDDSLIDELNNAFGKMPEGIKSNVSQKVKKSIDRKVFEEKVGAIQSGIRVGKLIDIEFGSTEYFQLKVLNTILGGYFGSRLMSNIREDKGYTYGIGSSVSYMKNACAFTIATEVGADVTTKTLDEIYYELNRLSEELVSEDELKVVKNYLLGAILKSSDGTFSLAQQFKGVNFQGKDLTYFEKYIKAIAEITTQDVKRVAQKYLQKDSMLEAVVGKL